MSEYLLDQITMGPKSDDFQRNIRNDQAIFRKYDDNNNNLQSDAIKIIFKLF